VNLVVVRLAGGLGNQMFQYAAGFALALRRGVELKVDLSWFGQHGRDTRRQFELDAFPIGAGVATPQDLAQFGRARRSRWPIQVTQILSRFPQAPGWLGRDRAGYRERHFHFDPRVLDLEPPVYLDGYWQSERYFADFADAVRMEFTPRKPLEPENAALAARVDGVHAVALHVRRGDYVLNPTTNRYHGTCEPQYYCNAVDYIAQRVAEPHLFVFSDDPQWVRSNLHFAIPTTFVDVNSPQRGYRDMQLMALCRHHIVANSSFSWWGAWLSTWRQKIVVAPERWFNDDSINTRDLVPEGWVRLCRSLQSA
jgi:hypothetical protein